MTWEEFREKTATRIAVKNQIVKELLDWVRDEKLAIVKHEPADQISSEKIKLLNRLIDKLNLM